MMDTGIDTQLMAKQAADTRDIVRFKQEMDGLKDRLAGDSDDKQKQLRKACQDFEAVFISQLWKKMKASVPKEGYLHSKQEEQYMSMFDREFAEKMSRAGGIGLADMIYEQLNEKLKETSQTTLGGGVKIKPLKAQPVALGNRNAPIALSQGDKAMTLEDWGGAPGAVSGEGAEQGEVVSSTQSMKQVERPVSDMDVKAQLDALARRLEAQRIKDNLLGNAAPDKVRGYGRESEDDTVGKLGREIAEIG